MYANRASIVLKKCYELVLYAEGEKSTLSSGKATTNEQLQAIKSDACGHYCIVFGVARSRGDTFRNIVGEMSSLTRDNIIKFIVNTLY